MTEIWIWSWLMLQDLPKHISCTFSSRGMADSNFKKRIPLQISLSKAMWGVFNSNSQTSMGMVWLTWSRQEAPHCSTSGNAPVFLLPLHAAARPRATRRPAHVSARRALTAPSAAFAAGIIHVKMGCARVALASSVCQARIQDIFCHLSHYHLKSWHLQPVPHEFFKHLQTQGVNSTTVNSKNAPQR